MTEQQGPCSRCGYGGKHLSAPPCTACTAYPRETKNNAQPPTNADRIRAMNDEELAKLFTHTVADGCPPDMDWDCAKDSDGWDGCDACWERWLQQPAEEDYQ